MGEIGIQRADPAALYWRTTFDAAAREAERWGTATPQRVRDQVTAPPAALFDAGPPGAPADFVEMATRGGGTEALAHRMWTVGLTAAEATDALTLAMRRPSIENFGPSRLLVEMLSWARSEGEIDSGRVQEAFRTLRRGVVVSPEGVWVRAGDGRPIQASPIEFEDGRASAGGLPVGGLYAADGGVLRALDARGRPSEVVGEIALQQDVSSAVLSGISKTFMSAVFEAVELTHGLVHAPEATLTGLVQAFGTLPDQVVAVAFVAPEMVERFQRLPAQAQQEIVGQVIGAAILAARSAAAARGVGRGLSDGVGQVSLRLSVGERGAASAVAWVEVEGMGAVAGGGLRAGAAGATLLRSRDGDVDDPKVRFANTHHIERRWGDPRVQGANIDELIEHLSPGAHPNTRKVYLRMTLESLESYSAMPLDDVARLRRAVDDAPHLQRELDVWVKRRFRQEIGALPDAATPQARARAGAIRQHAQEAGLSLHEVYRPGSVAPARETLSVEAQHTMKALDGGAREVHVSSRAVAEEILSQYPEHAQTQRWPKWKTKAFLQGFKETFHWDDVKGPDGRVLGHGPENPHGDLPHLQIETSQRARIHVFFPW